MRLAWKLTAVLVAGMGIVLALYALVRVRHDLLVYEQELRAGHRRLGQALSVPLAEVWTLDGEARALGLVDRINEREAPIHTRWVWLTGEVSAYYRPTAPKQSLEPVLNGKATTWVERGLRMDTLYTYVPVKVPDPRVGALEIGEPMERESVYVRDMVLGVVAATGGIAFLSGIIAMLAGVVMVGRPVNRLVDVTRRIGDGDFAARYRGRGADELAMLGEEMNLMGDRLAEASARVAEETQQRIRALEQLRHADRLMTVGKLASGLAHELGTPLNVVSGRAKLISSGELDEDEAMESASVIADQADRMTRIIRQLLDFARPQAPRKEPTDLHELAEKTLELLRPLAGKRRVELDLDGERSLKAHVDPVQIEQVLANLVVNGIQAMPEGGHLTVTLGRQAVEHPEGDGAPGTYVRLAVRDTGIGIPEEEIPHLFEPFFTTKPVGLGTGLGLSVAWGIVREHGGWIEVESRRGEGSTFALHLPVEER